MYTHFNLRFFIKVILKVCTQVWYLKSTFYRQHYETMASYDDRKRSDVTVQNSGRLASIEGSSADESQHKGICYQQSLNNM